MLDNWYDCRHDYGASVAKVTISIGSDVLKQSDRLVTDRVFASRSQAVNSAAKEKIARLNRSRLARACDRLDADEEQASAEIGASVDLTEGPEY